MKFHPDKNKHHKASDVFKKISAAYQILSDPIKREQYDRNPKGDLYSNNRDTVYE